MPRSAILLMAAAGYLLVPAATAFAEDLSQRPALDQSIRNVTVARPTWHRGAGLLYAEVTIRNRNPYPINQAIIACDFFDEWGNQIGSRGIAIGRPISPGRTRFTGIYFTATARNMLGGACRIVSAQRL